MCEIARQWQESIDDAITEGQEDGSCLRQCPGEWPNFSCSAILVRCYGTHLGSRSALKQCSGRMLHMLQE